MTADVDTEAAILLTYTFPNGVVIENRLPLALKMHFFLNPFHIQYWNDPNTDFFFDLCYKNHPLGHS